ncbi:MAG: exodeoxyribonuclease I [Pseudomonadales bacterium]
MSATFYWHDYETSGIDPALDRPIQFAGVRTDENLTMVGKPLVQFCKLPPDCLLHPAASEVTGLTPQLINREGVSEREFIARIQRELSQPNTCTVGYNSIRFDDEFTRHALYRNFYDAYEREYKNGNSRWDIIDVVRLCCALRPEDIEWPRHEDGKPSFRLEHLTAANGVEHGDAHDALSDVHATIGIAKILKQRKKKLYDYALQLRNKKFAAGLLATRRTQPVLHVSSKLPSENYCTSLMLPVAPHPVNKNGVICVDLRHDPAPLFDLSAADITKYLYTPGSERTAETPHIPLKTIHLNRCPIVATQKLLDDKVADRVNLDLAACEKHAAAYARQRDWLTKLRVIFDSPFETKQQDPEAQLYSGGFFSKTDRDHIAAVRAASSEQLTEQTFSFDDARLPELLFRYRARNFPTSLNAQEQAQWHEHCQQRLKSADHFNFAAFERELEQIKAAGAAPELVQELESYAQQVSADYAIT